MHYEVSSMQVQKRSPTQMGDLMRAFNRGTLSTRPSKATVGANRGICAQSNKASAATWETCVPLLATHVRGNCSKERKLDKTRRLLLKGASRHIRALILLSG